MQMALAEEVWMGRRRTCAWRGEQGCPDLSDSFHQPQDRAADGELCAMETYMDAAQAPSRLFGPKRYTLDTCPRPLLPYTHRSTQQTHPHDLTRSPRIKDTIVIKSAHMDVVRILYS